MKTKLFLAALILGTSAIANAQVLGGNVVGGVGGSLGGGSGGMRDIGAVGQGNVSGAFGADIASRSLRRSTSDVTGRTAQRARAGVNATRERTRSTVSSARNATDHALGTTHEHALGAASTAKAFSNARVDDAAAAQASNDASDTSLSGALDQRATTQLTSETARAPVNASGDAAANGDASASKEGVRARGSANGSANVSAGN